MDVGKLEPDTITEVPAANVDGDTVTDGAVTVN